MEWYQRRRVEQLRRLDSVNPALAAQLREFDALYLYGTLGFDSVMRSDGTVLVAVDEHWGEPSAPDPPWRVASPRERALAIAAASERWPEVAALLPDRPATARNCHECGGKGWWSVAETRFLCRACGALGWLCDAAT